MPITKQKLIYIAGAARSGSTLLSLIIGSAPEVTNLGELNNYNLFQNQQKHLDLHIFKCGCGQLFHFCNFWKCINKQSNFYIKKFYTKKETALITLEILGLLKSKNNTRDNTAQLIHLACQQTKTPFTLDASKGPRRLFTLAQDPNIELYPILIIRRGEAVANSLKRNDKKKKFYWHLFSWITSGFIFNNRYNR